MPDSKTSKTAQPKPTPVGLTKSQGWEIGIRRTLPISPERAWTLLMTPPGLAEWLGPETALDLVKGAPLKPKDATDSDNSNGIRGEIRSYDPGRLLRLTWQPDGWENPSTLQIRVTPNKTGATLSFHHEKLPDGEHREKMRRQWSDVLDTLERLSKK